MKEERKKGTHLTLEERHQIQEGLRWHRSFTEIGEMIGCSPDTVSKEIRRVSQAQARRAERGEPVQIPGDVPAAGPMREKGIPEVPDPMPGMYGMQPAVPGLCGRALPSGAEGAVCVQWLSEVGPVRL